MIETHKFVVSYKVDRKNSNVCVRMSFCFILIFKALEDEFLFPMANYDLRTNEYEIVIHRNREYSIYHISMCTLSVLVLSFFQDQLS